MAGERKTRREALRQILETVAVAAGLSTLEARQLFAQLKRPADIARLVKVRSVERSVKALKIMLAPRSQTAEVFASELGRAPAFETAMDPGTGLPVCDAFFGTGGACGELDCGLVVCNGLACPSLSDWGPDMRTLRQQERLSHLPQPGNAGASGDCTSHCTKCEKKPCWFNKAHINLGEVKSQWLREHMNDPYIGALMHEFDVSTPEALETELRQLLQQQRMVLR